MHVPVTTSQWAPDPVVRAGQLAAHADWFHTQSMGRFGMPQINSVQPEYKKSPEQEQRRRSSEKSIKNDETAGTWKYYDPSTPNLRRSHSGKWYTGSGCAAVLNTYLGADVSK